MTCIPCRNDAAIQKFNLENGTNYRNLGEGHDGCKGCTCQHHPVGSVEFLGSDPSRSV